MQNKDDIQHSVLQSIIMPGVFHDPGSCFVNIHALNEYKFSILLETCTQNGFVYYEHNFDNEKPIPVRMIEESTIIVLPTIKLFPEQFVNRIQDLDSNNYKKIFSGEVDEVLIKEFLWKPIELIKYLGNEQLFTISRLSALWGYMDHVNFSRSKTVFGIKMSLDLDNANKKPSYAERFYSGLNQLKLGIVDNNNIIDFSGSLGDGIAGKACIKTIAATLQTGSCSHLTNLKINLQHAHIGFAKNDLLKALSSNNCPPGFEIIGGIPDDFYFYSNYSDSQEIEFSNISKPSTEFKKLYNLIVFIQCLKLNKYYIPSEIFKTIGQLMTTDVKANDLDIIIGNSYRSNLNDSLSGRPLLRDFTQNSASNCIGELVCRQLDFNFTHQKQSYTLLSPKLRNKILQEIRDLFTEIFTQSSELQHSIWLDNLNHNIVSKLVGNSIKEPVFNVKKGQGIKNTGLTKICFDKLERYTTEIIGHSMFATKHKDGMTAFYNHLKADKHFRRDCYLLFCTLIAENANAIQLEFLGKEKQLLAKSLGKSRFEQYCWSLDDIRTSQSLNPSRVNEAGLTS